MRRTPHHRALLALTLLIGSLSTAPALAQDADSDDGTGLLRYPPPSDQQLLNALGPVLSTPFPGGTLEQYVAAVKKAAGSSAPTVMVRGDADAIPIGPVDLSDIQMFSALRLLDGLYTQPGGVEYFVDTANVADNAAGKPAYLVTIQVSGNRGGGAPATRNEFLVLPIKQLTTALPGDPPEVTVPAETVLTAIETALDLAGSSDQKPQMRYHPESGLILLAGPSPALSAAKDVVRQMDGDMAQRRDRARDLQQSQGLNNPDVLQEQLADARAQAELAEVRMQTAEQRLEMVAQQASEVEQIASQGNGSASDVRQARQAVSEAEAAVQEQRIQADRAHARVDQIAKMLERSRQIATGGTPDAALASLRTENDMLRERVALLEAELARLKDELKGRPAAGGSGRGGTR